MCEICSKLTAKTPERRLTSTTPEIVILLTSKCRLGIFSSHRANPANIYLFKVNNRNTIKSCEICLKLTIKTPERRTEPIFTSRQYSDFGGSRI